MGRSYSFFTLKQAGHGDHIYSKKVMETSSNMRGPEHNQD